MNNNNYPKYYIRLLRGKPNFYGEDTDKEWSGEFSTLTSALNHFERYRFDWQDTVEKYGLGIYVKKAKLDELKLVKKLSVY